MAMILKCGALFLHVPKTGGNWVTHVLEANGLVFAHVGGKHWTQARLAPLASAFHTPRRYGKANRPLFTFCFVRHPLRWYESWFRMNAALRWPNWESDDAVWNPSVELNGLGADTFAGFIDDVLSRRPGFLSALFDAYADGAHFVGRQERMEEDLLRVLRFLKVPFDAGLVRYAPRVNVSERAETSLSSALREALEASEARAYARFGYEREGLARGRARGRGPLADGVRINVLGPFVRDADHAWVASVPGWSAFADDLDYPERSLLQVCEDDVPLAAAHAAHDAIRSRGAGRYSHWGEAVYFSTSDNSDPNRNGRRYSFRWAWPADATSLALAAHAPASMSPEAATTGD